MKVQIPFLGKASGRSGNKVFQSYWGNTYVRSMPILFHYPDTPNQQKTQAAFFAIQRAWWEIYRVVATYIPWAQRKNKNVFNILSNGLFKSIMTYEQKSYNNVLKFWGIDKRKSVQLDITFNKIEWVRPNYDIKATLMGIKSTRKFVPRFCHYLLYNCTQQVFIYKNRRYTTHDIGESILVLDDWGKDDLIIAYIALSDESFLTNFYLCGL